MPVQSRFNNRIRLRKSIVSFDWIWKHVVFYGVLLISIGSGCQSGQMPTSAPANPADANSANHSSSNSSSSESTNQTGMIQFKEIAKMVGIDWTPKNGEEAGHHAILESLGSGCAISDFDQDGLLDIFVAGGGTFGPDQTILPVQMALYRQAAAWKFARVESPAGLFPVRHYSHGNYAMDFDEDGFPDLLITGYGGLQLFRNHGDGTFVDISNTSGLDDTSWSSAAAWGDLNGDGVLDLFIGHYVNWSFGNNPRCVYGSSSQPIVCAPSSFQGLPCMAYLGNGDATFREASQELGINEIGKTLGAIAADLNDDGQLDLYVANDTTPSHMYVRQPSGEFKEVGLINGVALGETGEADGSMGVDIGDLDGDGRLDIWVANFEDQSFALYRNLGDRLFRHSSRAFGITSVGTLAVGFGTVIVDVNGDGLEDIFCSNGHIHAPDFSIDRRQIPFLFLNERGKRFKNIAPNDGEYLRTKHVGRGLASADLDRNGTPDFVITHINEPTAVLRNDTPIKNWMSIRLIGRVSTRSAIGARVMLRIGDKQYLKSVRGGGSYLSTSDSSLLFGLGDFTEVDSIEVHWPSGVIQKMTQIKSRQRLDIVESANSQ